MCTAMALQFTSTLCLIVVSSISSKRSSCLLFAKITCTYHLQMDYHPLAWSWYIFPCFIYIKVRELDPILALHCIPLQFYLCVKRSVFTVFHSDATQSPLPTDYPQPYHIWLFRATPSSCWLWIFCSPQIGRRAAFVILLQPAIIHEEHERGVVSLDYYCQCSLSASNYLLRWIAMYEIECALILNVHWVWNCSMRFKCT